MASAKELAEFTGAAGKKLTATCLDARRWYYDEDLTHDIALIIGNETFGLSKAWKERCNVLARIPIFGAASSLNVGCATSICLYEIARQRANGKK